MLAVSYLDRGPSLQLGEEGEGCCLAVVCLPVLLFVRAQVWRTQHCPGSILLISVWLHSN